MRQLDDAALAVTNRLLVQPRVSSINFKSPMQPVSLLSPVIHAAPVLDNTLQGDITIILSPVIYSFSLRQFFASCCGSS